MPTKPPSIGMSTRRSDGATIRADRALATKSDSGMSKSRIKRGGIAPVADDVFTADVAWSPDGSKVACGLGTVVEVLDATSGETLADFAARQIHAKLRMSLHRLIHLDLTLIGQ